MNDVTTKQAAAWVFHKMGLSKLADDVIKDDSNVDSYVRLIKILTKKHDEIREFINYFL